MRLKLFRAAGMAEAMALVRADLGPDALILNSRTVPGGIEITAALEPEEEPLRSDPARLAGLTWHGVPRELHPALAARRPGSGARPCLAVRRPAAGGAMRRR